MRLESRRLVRINSYLKRLNANGSNDRSRMVNVFLAVISVKHAASGRTLHAFTPTMILRISRAS